MVWTRGWWGRPSPGRRKDVPVLVSLANTTG